MGGLRRGNFLELLERPLARADTGIVDALMRQQELRVYPTLVLLPHQILRRQPHLIEPDLINFVLAVQHDDGLDGDFGRLHVDEQK
jgi:hypothetical protein